ncbi:ABC-F family ATP-binding cassette domain-containing protein [Bogoriella caseilytica]|uniref:ABC-F family ATP-binding cassette domain-containing protein n=1 Tax=Bogoriella caseilytica TaxID=56055 RepID=UPI000F49D0FB|nr:ABC-F family ATP-binding cassette domain-containing protein [Bogoriella caseilytica]
MAHLLGAEGLHLALPDRVLLESVTLGVDEGDRIGVVGRNGDGKSTLLRLLAGTSEPDAGRVTRRGGVRLGMLHQSDGLDPAASVAQAIVGDRPEYEWAADPRVRDILAGLVSDLDWHSPVSALSGGQRRRVALAQVLVGEWDIVILDEPTNHLDVEGIAWLAGHLKRRWTRGSGAVLVVTHDRWFLDEVCTATWEVHDGLVEPFEGGYAAYVLQRVERDRQAATAEAKRQNLMKKELAWLRRGAPARTSKPKFRIDAATQLIQDVPPPRDTVQLTSTAVARLGKDVVDLLEVSAGYGDHTVIRDITWRLAPGERTGLLGANGAGKSTLLNVISGTLTPSSGRVKRGKTVRLAVLDQQFSQLAEIAGDRVREVLARSKASFEIDGKELTPAQLLERLGFARDQLSTRVSDLSGGQRRRLQLLMVLLDEPNVLILDEPTNDLDTDMLAAMEDLLDSWPGTLIVVSHDRYLLERVTDQQYAVLDGRLRHLPGGVDEYLGLRAAQGAIGTGPTGAGEPAGGSAGAGSGEDPEAPSGAELHAARKELAGIERKLGKFAARRKKVHDRMAAHDQGDYTGLAELTAELRALDEEEAELEERWLEVTEILG